jgi:hypothetical protein
VARSAAASILDGGLPRLIAVSALPAKRDPRPEELSLCVRQANGNW